MVMTLPGVAYIYYGQEIGMAGSRIRDDQQVDKFVDDFTKKPRDSARLPMQWDDSLNAGIPTIVRVPTVCLVIFHHLSFLATIILVI